MCLLKKSKYLLHVIIASGLAWRLHSFDSSYQMHYLTIGGVF